MAGENTVVLNDFTPGIYSYGGFASKVPPTPLGSAQETNTYRCIGLPSGGLAPLPRKINSYSITHPGVGTTSHIVGLGVNLTTRSAAGSNQSVEYVRVVLDADTNPRRNYCYALDTHNGTFALRPWYTTNFLVAPGATTNFISLVTTNTQPPAGVTFSKAIIYTSGLNTYEMFSTPAAATIGGLKPVYWFEQEGSAALSWVRAALATSGISAVGYHSGRVIGISDMAGVFGSLYYWKPYLNTGTPPTFAAGVTNTDEAFFFSNALRYMLSGSYGSISTGEFLVIGGVPESTFQISGDLDNPTVTNLPGVHPTGRFLAPGLTTSIGLLYATESDGIWLWNGGNTSKKVSPQLQDDFFIRTTNTGYSRPDVVVGSSLHAAVWGDYALYPNNFLFDTQTLSWWKLDDTTAGNYQVWASVTPRYAYGTVDSIIAATTNSMVRYDATLAATSYSWQSQPIETGTAGTLVEVYDIEVKASVSAASSNQTVTITLTNEAGATQAETFTFNSALGIPKRLRKTTYIRGFDIIVRIEADGGANGAPIVHSVTLSTRAGAPTADV